jgi:hypothetical protein
VVLGDDHFSFSRNSSPLVGADGRGLKFEGRDFRDHVSSPPNSGHPADEVERPLSAIRRHARLV